MILRSWITGAKRERGLALKKCLPVLMAKPELQFPASTLAAVTQLRNRSENSISPSPACTHGIWHTDVMLI
ncbi:hypothetical protein EWB00_001357 [Schistosoma japonicum]|uniref:Uncharacterized protein n=1 Tax=Schistosoma japonicum TaxID=6182 RepID=A0A4Z2CJZ1_SCHJA|nr:hypothetical protein EWB00_001357 [Schistosoma japonicum]